MLTSLSQPGLQCLSKLNNSSFNFLWWHSSSTYLKLSPLFVGERWSICIFREKNFWCHSLTGLWSPHVFTTDEGASRNSLKMLTFLQALKWIFFLSKLVSENVTLAEICLDLKNEVNSQLSAWMCAVNFIFSFKLSKGTHACVACWIWDPFQKDTIS